MCEVCKGTNEVQQLVHNGVFLESISIECPECSGYKLRVPPEIDYYATYSSAEWYRVEEAL